MADGQLSVELRAEVQKYIRDMNNAGKATKQTGGTIDSAASKIGGAVAGAFSIGAIVSFGKAVLDVTAEFQKFSAVLGNTLGSQALADLKLKEIQDFAAKTPFGVNELTGAFVKLANAGFKPTGDEMTKLGDLASSTGKSFDQLAEAILDAQSGEFERLKEFGVRAKDAGDSVIFTYKGVQTQVDKTAGSIRNYITSLGDAEGVSGSMEKISATLTGQISNLGDTWDQMLLSVGKNTSGVFSGSISIIGMAIQKVTDFNNQLEIASKYKIGNTFTRILEGIKSLTPGGAGPSENQVKILGIETANESVNKFVSNAIAGAKSAKDFGDALKSLKERGDKDLKNIKDPQLAKGIKDAYQNGVKAIQDARSNLLNTVTSDANFGTSKGDKKIKSVSDILSELQENLRKTSNQFKATFDQTNEGKIKDYQTAIDELSKKTGTDAVNAINKLKNAQQSLFQLSQGKTLTGSVNQGLPEQRNSLGQKGLEGINVTDPTLNAFKKVEEARNKLLEGQIQFNKDFNQIITSGLSNGLGSLGDAIGGALASGGNVLEAAGQSLLSSLGGILVDLGKLSIQTGIGIAAVKKALQSLNPAVAIAAGIGLVALGSYFKGKASQIGGGSSSESGSSRTRSAIPQFAAGVNNFSGGMALVGERGPELVNLPTGSSVIPNRRSMNMIGRQDANIVLNGSLEVGLDRLYVRLMQEGKKQGRLG